MRQIGTIATAEHARRFAAYLATEKIATHVEPEGPQWSIWVRNEDQLDAARAALERFNLEPDDQRYREAEAKAAQLIREEQQQAARARKNVVNVRSQWGSQRSPFQRAPLTCMVIALCVFVFFLMQTEEGVSAPQRWLAFTEIRPSSTSGMIEFARDGYRDIRNGQIWRLVTPAFLHFGWMHIGFNMLMLYSLGSRIEHRYGAWRMGLLMLATAMVSNWAQYGFEGNPNFGGMSGVVYALFGFAWMKTMYDPQSGIHVDQQLVTIMLIWLFIGMAAAIPPLDQYLGSVLRVANTAHFAGLAVGMAICGVTLAFRRK